MESCERKKLELIPYIYCDTVTNREMPNYLED